LALILDPGTLKTHSDPYVANTNQKTAKLQKNFMSFKWLLGLLKGGREKFLTSAKNNINIPALYKH